MSRALHASPSDLATGVAAVAVATIARAADVEALGAHAAANLPEAVLHESPCERAEKLSPRRGSCETNRASVCCRVPESPGSSPGLSLFRRAACRRSLGSARAPANFPAARARPRRYDVSGGNLRIGEAINRGLAPLNDGLSFLDGSACPHYDGDPDRRPAFHRAIAEGLPAGYAADDGAALHFAGHDLVGAVSSRSNARAYRVEVRGGEVIEEPLTTRYLGQ